MPGVWGSLLWCVFVGGVPGKNVFFGVGLFLVESCGVVGWL